MVPTLRPRHSYNRVDLPCYGRHQLPASVLPSIILAASIQTDRETWQRRVWDLGMDLGSWMAQLIGTAGTVPYQKTELQLMATVCHSEILGKHLAFSMVYFFKMQK